MAFDLRSVSDPAVLRTLHNHPERAAVAQYIADGAQRRGLDPETTLRGLNQESGFNVNARNLSNREQSYGIAQLNTMGGLGEVALNKGIDVRDPSQWRQQADFSLDTMQRDGYRQWYGFRDVGVGRWDGHSGAPTGSSGGQRPAPSNDIATGSTGNVVLMGGAGTDTLSDTAPTPPETNPGSLGGLGGFLKSDGFGDVLTAIGRSLASTGSPFEAFGENLDAAQKGREQRNLREEARQEKLNDRNATQAVLQQAGLSADQAKAYASNPTAATLALNLHQKQADRDSYSTFARSLYPSTAPTTVDPTPVSTAPGSGGSSLLAPTSLTDTVSQPAASPTGPASSAGNQTLAYRSRLQAESDRLYQVATTARSDDERQAVNLAIKANDAKLAQIDKLLERNPTLTSIYTNDGGEQKGYFDNGQFVPVGGVKRPSNNGGITVGPDGTVQIGGSGVKVPANFMPDPDNPGRVKPIPGGPGEQLPSELAARIGLADNFLKQAPGLREKLVAGDVTGPADRFMAGNNQSSPQAGVYRQLESGTDALMRLLTGAGMNQTEAEAYARRYLPTYTDDAGSAAGKLDQLIGELSSAKQQALQGRGGTATPKTAPAGGSTGTTTGGLKWSVE